MTSCDFDHVLDPASPYVCCLSNDLLLKAQKELHEKPEWRQRDIDAVRQMAVAMDDLNPATSDRFLLKFLRARKFDYERATQLLVDYYAVRHGCPDIFSDCLPSLCRHVFFDRILHFLADSDYHGRRILYVDLNKWKPESVSLEELVRAIVVALETELCLENIQVLGISVIVDLRTTTLATVVNHLKPAVIKKLVNCFMGSFPMRLKAIHLVQESTLMDVLVTLVKPFMSEKLRQRIHFHGSNTSSLQQHMDPEVLPECLGGSASAEDAFDPNLLVNLNAAENYFANLMTFGFTQSPRSAEEPCEGSPLRSVLTTYKRICIDGLNT